MKLIDHNFTWGGKSGQITDSFFISSLDGMISADSREVGLTMIGSCGIHTDRLGLARGIDGNYFSRVYSLPRIARMLMGGEPRGHLLLIIHDPDVDYSTWRPDDSSLLDPEYWAAVPVINDFAVKIVSQDSIPWLGTDYFSRFPASPLWAVRAPVTARDILPAPLCFLTQEDDDTVAWRLDALYLSREDGSVFNVSHSGTLTRSLYMPGFSSGEFAAEPYMQPVTDLMPSPEDTMFETLPGLDPSTPGTVDDFFRKGAAGELDSYSLAGYTLSIGLRRFEVYIVEMEVDAVFSGSTALGSTQVLMLPAKVERKTELHASEINYIESVNVTGKYFENSYTVEISGMTAQEVELLRQMVAAPSMLFLTKAGDSLPVVAQLGEYRSLMKEVAVMSAEFTDTSLTGQMASAKLSLKTVSEPGHSYGTGLGNRVHSQEYSFTHN